MATNFPDTSVDNTFVTPNRPWADGDIFDDTAESGLIYYWYDPVWKTNAGDISSVPDLQAVTDVGYTTDNPIRVGDGSVTGGMLLNNGGTAGNSYFEVYGNSNTNDTQTAIYVRPEKDVGDHTIKLKYDGSGEFAGDVQMASQNGGPLAGFRNQIINGDFRIWQRGNSFGGFTYSSDRWLTSNTNVTHESVERIDTALVTGGNHQFMTSVELPFVGNPAAYGPGPFRVGSQWTISLYTTGQPQVRFGFTNSVLSGGDDVEVLSDTALVRTGKTIGILEQWSLTFTVASQPNATNTALRLVFTFGGDAHLTMVQLEPGPVATPFEHRPIGTELALCKRYYNTGKVGTSAGVGSTGALRQNIFYPSDMRTKPTTSYTNGWAAAGNAEDSKSGCAFKNGANTPQEFEYTADAEL